MWASRRVDAHDPPERAQVISCVGSNRQFRGGEPRADNTAASALKKEKVSASKVSYGGVNWLGHAPPDSAVPYTALVRLRGYNTNNFPL